MGLEVCRPGIRYSMRERGHGSDDEAGQAPSPGIQGLHQMGSSVSSVLDMGSDLDCRGRMSVAGAVRSCRSKLEMLDGTRDDGAWWGTRKATLGAECAHGCAGCPMIDCSTV